MADTERDAVRRFLFEGLNIRGELVHLAASWRAVCARREYPPAIRTVLGEALAAAALMASTFKFDGELTLQLQGDGPLSLLVVECTSACTLRGLASFSGAPQPAPLDALTGNARLSITVASGTSRKRFQGIVPLEGATLADCMQRYFDRSLQLPTRLWLSQHDGGVAGMMLQKLPGSDATPTDRVAGDDDWQRLALLAGTITDEELATLGDRELLRRLFNEDDVRLFQPRPVSFFCSCTRQRIEAALKALGRDEIESVVAEQGRVETTCEFCNASYTFDAVDVEALFSGDAGGQAPPTQIH